MKHGLIIFLVALAVYLNSLGGAFVSDDRPLLLDHPYTKKLSDFPAIFTAGHYAGHGGYRPLTTASFALNYQVSGANPLGYHLLNVLLHALTSVLLYLLVRQLFRTETAAWLAALIFAVHPVHTEAVAWISGRAELLAALFSLGSWLLYLRGRLLLALLLFFGAVLSKENALVLPVLIVAGDLYLRRRDQAPWQIKSYFAFAAVVAFYFAFSALLYHHSIVRPAEQIAASDNPLAAADAGTRILTALKIVGQYFLLLIWPRRLIADYSPNTIGLVHELTDWSVLGTFVLLAALGEVALHSFLRRGRIWLPIVLAIIALAPTANLFLPIGTIKAERLLYLPSIDFCLALGLIWDDLKQRTERKPELRWAGYAILGVALLLCSLRTALRNLDWRSEISLWSATARSAPQNFRAHLLLGSEFLRAGKFDYAVAANERALAIDPDSEDALLNLGVALVQSGRLPQAMELYERALAEKPRGAAFHIDLGLAYAARGDILSAADSFREGTRLNPRNAAGYLNLGLALSQMGEKEEALTNYQRATELKPDYAEAWNALGALSLKLGRKEEARAALHRALALRPDYHEASFNLQLLDKAAP